MREWGLCGAAKDDLPSTGKSSLATQLPPFLMPDFMMRTQDYVNRILVEPFCVLSFKVSLVAGKMETIVLRRCICPRNKKKKTKTKIIIIIIIIIIIA
uniref:Uncharacterized protein n=1 Tax=Salix viminalis TaxID=40686 RepID=A0A6N2LRV0_SALVM